MTAPKVIWAWPWEVNPEMGQWEANPSIVGDGRRHISAAATELVGMVDTLKYYAEQFCEGFCEDFPSAGYTDEKCELDCGGCKARAALAAWEALK